MSIALRILLVIGALFTFLYVLRRVRKCEMNVGDTVFWIVFSAALMILAVFPRIAYLLSEILGFMSPINFIVVLVIAVLVLKIFSMSIEISRLRDRLSALVQDIGLERNRDK